jgi:hypothetical protein
MRLLTLLVSVGISLAACAAHPLRTPDSIEQLCFGSEIPTWNVLDPKSALAFQLKAEIATLEALALSHGISRETIVVSPRQRHAAICRLGTLPSGKGCVAEKWNLFQDKYDRWFVEKHFVEACQVWEEIVITS